MNLKMRCVRYIFILGVITFSPHELPAYVILPPRTTTSTKKEHQTTIFTYFAPFRQSNSCKDLDALTQFQKSLKYPHFKDGRGQSSKDCSLMLFFGRSGSSWGQNDIDR
jgi:hypothetical protein